MSRRYRHVMVLLVAVATAAVASFFVYRAIAQLPAQQGERMATVVVATRPLVIGSQVTEKDIRLVSWPASSMVPGAITDPKDALDRGLLAAIMQNEPLTAGKLASPEAGAGLPPAIPHGMRAMSVRVNDGSGVAGFILPGSRVDVVVTMRRGQDSVTRTAASNVHVLTAGTRKDLEKAGETKSNDRGDTVVTMMVTPGDAERIALAQSEGQIMLVLRNPLDTETVATTGVKTAALLGTEEAPAPAPVVKRPVAARKPATPTPAAAVLPAAPPPPRTVEAIRAAKRTEEVIK